MNTEINTEGMVNNSNQTRIKEKYKGDQLVSIQTFQNGILNGYSEEHNCFGKEVMNYKNGKLNGDYITYNKRNQLRLRGGFEMDKRIGNWMYYTYGTYLTSIESYNEKYIVYTKLKKDSKKNETIVKSMEFYFEDNFSVESISQIEIQKKVNEITSLCTNTQ